MIKQVIVVRMLYPDGRGGTFKPRIGKLAAQVAHASMKVFFDRRGQTESACLVVPLTADMIEWVNGIFTKVVLGVDSEADLLAVYEQARAAGLPCSLIQDVGATEFHGVPTYTTVAIGPAESEKIDPITKTGTIKTRLI